MSDNSKKYTVYMHVFPDNRKYIGMTVLNPVKRWGRGQKYNKRFREAVHAFGWDNVKHEIIAENLAEKDAIALEKSTIIKYNTISIEYGFNIATGGWGSVKSEDFDKFSRQAFVEFFSIPIVQFSLSGNFIRHFTSLTEACKILHMNVASLCECLSGVQHTAGGYQWRKFSEWDGNAIKDISVNSEIVQFSLGGKYMKTWNSLADIRFETGMNLSGICNCCSKVSNSSQGYQWRKFSEWDGNNLCPFIPRSTAPILQYTLSKELVKRWPSIMEASRAGYSRTMIKECLRGRYASVNGYIWKYAKGA